MHDVGIEVTAAAVLEIKSVEVTEKGHVETTSD
jgi:hypothetical protein